MPLGRSGATRNVICKCITIFFVYSVFYIANTKCATLFNSIMEKLQHCQNIEIDLDDGVKENYDKFKDILAKIK